MLLSPELHSQLEAFASSATLLLKRRAELLLWYDAGLTTREVAARVGLSAGRTRYWRRQFQLKDTAIFRGALVLHSEGVAPESAPIDIAQFDDDSTVTEVNPTPPLLVEKPKAPGLLPDESMAEAGRKTLLYHFAEMLLHEPGARSGEDIEELHRMRVATRRMRAAFDLFAEFFKPKAIRSYSKGLRTVGRALGTVRDLDVFIEKITQYQATLPEADRSDFEPLVAAWREQRLNARTGLVLHLNSSEYQDFTHKFAHFLTTSGLGAAPLPHKTQVGANVPGPHRVCDIVPVLIFSRLAAVRAYDDILPSATFPQLHSLRIECKKLRYALEFFREVLSPPASVIIEELKGIQDHLGDLHDADVAIQLLSKFLEEWEIKQGSLPLLEREDPQPILAYLSVKHTERHNLLTSFPQAWAHFIRPETMQNLTSAVSVL